MPILLRSSVASGESYRLSDEHRSNLDGLVERELHGHASWLLRLPTPTSPHHYRDVRPRIYPGMRAHAAATPPLPPSPARRRRCSDLSPRWRRPNTRSTTMSRLKCRLQAWWSRWMARDGESARERRRWSVRSCQDCDRVDDEHEHWYAGLRHSMPGPVALASGLPVAEQGRRASIV